MYAVYTAVNIRRASAVISDENSIYELIEHGHKKAAVYSRRPATR